MLQPPPPRRTWETYFDAVERNLMVAPPGSDLVLKKALAGHPPRDPAAAGSALYVARQQDIRMWNPEFLPPPSTPYVAFPMEGGICDVIRARYMHGGYVIGIAESRYLYSVTLSGLVRDPSASLLELAVAAARLLFPAGVGLSLVQISEGATLPAFGEQDPSKRKYDLQRVYWPDWMSWWVDKDVIGFITLKGDGTNWNQEVVRSSRKRDIHWFTDK